MKPLSEKSGIEKLGEIRTDFRGTIAASFEHRARPCASCETPGICCRDEHFVNVHISKLEAAAIVDSLNRLDAEVRRRVRESIIAAVEKYGLGTPGDSFVKTYACPLFEKGIGCLVHETAKPLPCIAHACYEKESDLPPDELLETGERKIARLNRRVYGSDAVPLPIPASVLKSIENDHA